MFLNIILLNNAHQGLYFLTVWKIWGYMGSDFIFPDTFVAVISGDDGWQLRGDKFWLIRVDQTDLIATGDTVDSYGHRIPEGHSYISGHFLERLCDSRKSTIYQEEERTTFFYRKNVVYPFVELQAKNFKGKNCLELHSTEKTYVLNYMDENGCSHI